MKFQKAASRTIVGLGLVWLLTAVFYDNMFSIGSPVHPPSSRPNVFETFQSDSEMSVSLMMEKVKRDGLWSSGGFMMQRSLTAPPYLSAWGLQGKVFSVVYLLSDQPLAIVVDRSHLAISLLSAIVLTVFVFFAWREWGVSAATALVIGICLSEWMVFAARNLYLVYILHLLPFILSLVLYPLMKTQGRFRFLHYTSVIGFAVLVKSLCFFDYSSNIVIGSAVGPIYFGIKHSDSWRQISRRTLIILAVSSAAVIAAIIATGIQAGLWMHSMQDGFGQLMGAASSRMYSATQLARAAPASVSIWQILDTYLTIPAIGLPFYLSDRYRIYLSFFAALTAWLPLALTSLLDDRIIPAVRGHRQVILALSAATLWAMGGSLSWAFLMKGHMWHHPHMNGMIFYIPYMLLLYPLTGKALSVVGTFFVSTLCGSHKSIREK